MKVNYFINDKTASTTSVYAIVRYKGQRYKFTTGISVKVGKWDESAKRARERGYDEAEIINIKLGQIEKDVNELFNKYAIDRRIPTPAEFKADIADVKDKTPNGGTHAGAPQYFTDFFTSYYKAEDYAPGTKKKYDTAAGWLRRYETEFNSRLTFNNIDLEFYETFRAWMLKKKYRPSKSEPLKYYSANFIGSVVKCIKRVMSVSGPDGHLKLHNNTDYKSKLFKVEAETADTIYLTADELRAIHQWTPTVHNIEGIVTDKRVEIRMRAVRAMQLAKNKFLIGAFTALRVSDFNRLREVNVKDNVIRIKPRKGTRKNEDVVIPIHPIVREIIDSGFRVDTEISDQKLNKQIKHVCQLVGINEPVSVSRTEGGKLVEREFEKWQLVSTHTARRSGATNMYLAGIPTISIMKITGHRTESSFLKYIKISQEENANLLANHPFFRG